SGLSCLFGFENEGLGELDDTVLCSDKFIKEVKEEWWKRDWVHIGNLQALNILDKNKKCLCEGDIVTSSIYGTSVIKFQDNSFVLWNKGSYTRDYKHYVYEDVEIIGNIYENL